MDQIQQLLNGEIPRPPVDYFTFLRMQTAEHERKDHDYQSRFMRGLIEHGRGVWDWEVDKKLDRLRTWITHSELWVKNEGVHNSVGDLFNYTVQFAIYMAHATNSLQHLKPVDFFNKASSLSPAQWVDFLISEGRIRLEEKNLQLIIRYYMGERISPETWRSIIKEGTKVCDESVTSRS